MQVASPWSRRWPGLVADLGDRQEARRYEERFPGTSQGGIERMDNTAILAVVAVLSDACGARPDR
jgi:hypothetical protein